MTWNPETYLRFADHRTRPAVELLARVPRAKVRLAVDLGCGPGNSTALLAARWPAARLIGVDSAPAMLERARRAGIAAEWVEADAAAYLPPEPPDLIFANALLQWVPGHSALFPRLLDGLAPGGVLAVQMPCNFAAPSHVLLRETAREGPWAAALAGAVREPPVLAPDAYYDLLDGPGVRLDIWTTEYVQVLNGPDAVLDWVKGTALVPLLGRLDGAAAQRFVQAYRAKLRRAYPRRPDGTTLFPFRRIFIVAQRG